MRALVLAAVVLSASPAPGDQRPNTLRMKCASIQTLVASRGAIVLTTGQFLYARYVRDGSFCLQGQLSAQPEFVPAADNPDCLLYTCKLRSHGRID
jgi:hypothetical protein